ncbi:GntR family transcriptional regulator [Rubellicoccus peritrichatus]|uniref:GntR family transcriptional regulator n=1 Tax=Rubellicoccus peritrichatus TaxID=3080537 RepID=A0AAQ3LD08_9BACT|nr:GntR family transcriptional regulator [Puniceicoccus sp. CR14]WOO39724.1 GntR family transcriptional regulator [Puniceicoccus sp. CR14]
MARTRSEHVKHMKSELIDRLEAGFCRPGSNFCSNRELTMRYGVSYQTAHRIIRELELEGYLHRVPSSGTYIARASDVSEGVALIVHPDWDMGSFGSILLDCLQARFDAEGVSCQQISSVSFSGYIDRRYNIIFGQQNYDLRQVMTQLQYSLMIDAYPGEGLNATFTDTISIDYHQVGLVCGHCMREKVGNGRFALLAGPELNNPYMEFINGITEVVSDCKILYQNDWSYWAALESAHIAQGESYDGFFAVEGNGVAALRSVFGDLVSVVSYGDADYMRSMKAEGVAVSWQRIADEAVRLYRLRNGGDASVGYRSVIESEYVDVMQQDLYKVS